MHINTVNRKSSQKTQTSEGRVIPVGTLLDRMRILTWTWLCLAVTSECWRASSRRCTGFKSAHLSWDAWFQSLLTVGGDLLLVYLCDFERSRVSFMRKNSPLREILLTVLNSPSILHQFLMANSLPAVVAAAIEEAMLRTRLLSNPHLVSFISCLILQFIPLITALGSFAWMSSPYVFRLWSEVLLRAHFKGFQGTYPSRAAFALIWGSCLWILGSKINFSPHLRGDAAKKISNILFL